MTTGPSVPSREPEPLETMDKQSIEAELAESEIATPPRWEMYTIEQQRATLARVRTGEIPQGYQWPTDGGSRDFFHPGFSQEQ